MATIDVQDDDKIVIVADVYEATLTEDKIENLFQDTSSEEELETELLEVNLHALQEEPSFLQELRLCTLKYMIKEM